MAFSVISLVACDSSSDAPEEGSEAVSAEESAVEEEMVEDEVVEPEPAHEHGNEKAADETTDAVDQTRKPAAQGRAAVTEIKPDAAETQAVQAPVQEQKAVAKKKSVGTMLKSKPGAKAVQRDRVGKTAKKTAAEE